MKRQGRVKNETEEMMRRHAVMNKTAPLLAISLFLGSLGVAGNGGVGLASNETGPLQIAQESVSGTASQLPLRIILDQFREQLGIDYKASNEELAKPISVELQQVSIQQALEKILANWDYALKIDQEGHIQHIFVLEKILAGGEEEQTIKAEAARGLPAGARRGRTRARLSPGEPHVALSEAPVDSFALSGAAHTPHVSSPRDEERPWVVMEEAGVAMIPPAGPAELDITPMPEWDQQGIVQALESSDGDSFSAELDIMPTPEWEQQAIIQALESDNGDSFSAEMEMTNMSEEEQQAFIQALESSQ